jgi:hypothetical protein
MQLETTQVFRDYSAWYMITLAVDTTQATSSNRVKLYVNGSQVTSFSTATYPAQNTNLLINSNIAHYLGTVSYSTGTNLYGGYLTEVNFIDGQQLTPSSFGMTNPQTGQWIPLKYSGTYGANGFYLNFKDATSTTTLGYDYSGNANNWTTNNFSVTAGAGNDSLTDVPTPWFAYNTTGDVGGVVRGNYATWNPLDKDDGITSVTEGNLKVVTNGSNGSIKSTIAFPSGKWYWEVTSDSINAAGTEAIGIMPQSQPPTNNMSDTGKLGYAIDASNSDRKFENGTATSYGTYTQANGAIYMLAFDQDAGKLWYGVDGTWLASGNPATGANPSSSSISTTTAYCAAVSDNTVSGTFTANFGNRAFAYTPPAGFRSLCTTNLPATAIGFGLTNQANYYFDVKTWSGNSSTQSIALNFAPDFIWNKSRSAASGHSWWDVIRGTGAQISSSETDAETTGYNAITSFSNDAISLGVDNTGTYNGRTNETGRTYVGWVWNAGNSTVTNTSGTISSQVRASTTAGFSIVTYTGNGTNGASVGHGLGVAPSMIIIKNRTDSASAFWCVYHRSAYVSGADPNVLYLNSTAAQADDTNVWGSSPDFSSTIFKLGDYNGSNGSGKNLVAYCFAAVAGYSAFGSYTGNGSTDGTFVYTGFRPRWVMIKASSTGGAGYDWFIHDTARDTYNVCTLDLEANLSSSENQYGAEQDILSNGFKLRNTGGGTNGSGVTYIYAAFAESPFQFANAR